MAEQPTSVLILVHLTALIVSELMCVGMLISPSEWRRTHGNVSPSL